MHLRFAGGFDTMALRRRRIVSSRGGSGRYRGWPHWTFPGWSDHDLRAAAPAAERGPGRDARPAQSPVSRSRARRKWSSLPGVHHPRHRYTRGTLAMPNSRGRRGRTGHNLTGTKRSLTPPAHPGRTPNRGQHCPTTRPARALVPQQPLLPPRPHLPAPGRPHRRHDRYGPSTSRSRHDDPTALHPQPERRGPRPAPTPRSGSEWCFGFSARCGCGPRRCRPCGVVRGR